MNRIKTMVSTFVLSILIFSCSGDNETITTNTATTTQLRITTPKRFLFDATKAQTAGNADWVICQNTIERQSVFQIHCKVPLQQRHQKIIGEEASLHGELP